MERTWFPGNNARSDAEQNTQYLTGMPARTLAYKFMVLMPAIFFAALGVQSRTHNDPFEPVGQDFAEQAAMTEYGGVVKATNPLLEQSQSSVKVEALRSVADLWISQADSGKLKPLYPVAVEDFNSDGVKGQIFGAKTRLVSRLLWLANKESRANKPVDAMEDFLRSIQVSQVLKFSSFESVHACSVEQQRALHGLQALAPKLSSNQSEWLVKKLEDVGKDQRSLNTIASVSRRVYLEERQRRGEEPLGILDAQDFTSMRKLIDRHTEAKEWRQQISNTMVASNDISGPRLMTQARLSCESQRDFAAQLSDVVQTLKRATRT